MKKILAFAVLSLGPLALLGACTTDSLVGSGGACFQSIDCQLGLVCIYPMGSDAGSCTSNLNGIVDVPDTSVPDAAQPDTAMTDQSIPDNNVPETPPQETGTPETGTTDAPPG